MRMGKGKGAFDHWAARVAVNQVVFEIKGNLHEQVVRDAFRLAGIKLPGTRRAPGHEYWDANVFRPMGVCQEGGTSCCWNYQVRWDHSGGTQAAKEKASCCHTARGRRDPQLNSPALMRGCMLYNL